MERKKMLQSAILAIAVIVIIVLVVVIGKVVEKYTPSEEIMDLYEYYELNDTSKAAIILDNEKIETQAVVKDGTVYMDITAVKEMFNDRFYWDTNENLLLYTTPTDVISAAVSGKEYFVTKEAHAEDYVIVYADADTAYVALDYVKKFSNMDFVFYEDPNVVVVTTDFSDYQTVPVEEATQVRYRGGIKSPILVEVAEAEVLTVLETGEDWDKVATKEGVIGYVQKKRLGKVEKQSRKHTPIREEFSHILKDEKINMAWHQVTTTAANSTVTDVISNTKGLNVVSPTWFYLNDNDGGLVNLASKDYVEYCHNQGIEVWALVSNLENEDVDTTEVLSHTSKRSNVVNQLIAAAIEYNLDGINVDFEALNTEAKEGYIQFIRELSLKCENNGIILSVDNYVPTEYTAFYNRKEQANFADYIIMMGYDEHYAGSDEGSVASIGFVTQGIKDTLEEVPAEQLILAAPLYTRIWALTPKEGVTGDSVESASEDFKAYDVTSEAVGMQEGWRRASVNGAEPVWSEEDGQYYAEYINDSVTYKIWLEDTESMELRLQAAADKGLAGVSFWKLGFEDSSFWDTVIKYMNE
ncbi:MAG: glycosyl hydrolase family 18 [Lachnospiraceae bacterium]|nr:glycosyl hydrolase family 18 [Lachnospiraceae bacterium]